MALFRTFIAISVSPEVRKRAGELMNRFRKCGTKVNWSSSENLHLTVKFLGDTHDSKIPDVCRGVARAVAEVPPFNASLDHIGAFPSSARPRAVWIGVDEGQAALQAVQARIEDEMLAAGFKRERRRYVPHMTIGRVREGGVPQRELGELITANAEFSSGTTRVDEVVSMASFFESEGTTYQVLGRAKLGG